MNQHSASMASPLVVVVLPAYNEAAAISGLIADISSVLEGAQMPFRIVVVDDGSADGTAGIVDECAKNGPVTLIRHTVNQNLGPTIRDGLAHACTICGDGDIIIALDADGTHPPSIMPRMVEVVSGGIDVVIASRFVPGGRVFGVPAHRRILSDVASLIMRLRFPSRGLRDYTCGYRAYRAGMLKRAFSQYGEAFVDQVGFQCMVDILLKLRSMGASFAEVPLQLHYELKAGASKMKVIRTIMATLRLVLRR